MASIFDHLRDEHQRLRESLLRLGDHAGREPHEQHEQLCGLLFQYTAYARAEERAFYSYMIHLKEVQQPALQALAEHERLDTLLRQAERMPLGDARWRSTITFLCERMIQHLREEESNLLARARSALSEREAAGLGAHFQAERARVHRDLTRLDAPAPEHRAT
ncbi:MULTISPECIES: hemerythrin domain-containing protein [Nannocystis]|uniref:Hemerythrin domain-containing protein n=1 Tax=Nannocystis radixulma TaxID=2995305 RepID=A0ABT5BJQ0_9BACT|nr:MULTISPECIES: hemerythrin domain-containing protein [Nannocystis]MCY1062812.1 hemerythrin domain-containing protein [Nannocystis sp. SCPEA4]MDC0674389.1 hemerythrin domain-containing protein [Nannocystis radixulma]